MRGWIGTAGVTAVFGLVVGAAPAPAQESETLPGATEMLVGEWILNPVLSDDPSELVPPPVVRPGAEREPPRQPSGTAPLRQAVERFSLTQTDSTIVIAYPDRDLVLYPDGEKHEDVIDEDLRVDYRAWRENSSLVIERTLDGDVTLTERYSLVEATGRLHVLTRLESDRMPRTLAFVRVYDPASD